MDKQPTIKILYIEDDPALCDLFKTSVEYHGYDVDVAVTGDEGLALSAQTAYDVVATDYKLPDMTGIDIARKLLSEKPDLPILMITGQGNHRLAIEAMTLGIANYVVKDDAQVYLELIPGIIAHLLERAKQKQTQYEIEAEVQRSRQQLKTATEMAKLGYWEWDEIRDCATYYSPTLREVLDVDPTLFVLGEIDGEVDRSRIHPDDREEYAFISRFSDGSKDTFDIEYRTTGQGGDIIYCREIGQAVRDSSGAIVSSHGTVQNITDKVLLERDISERNVQISQIYKLARVGTWIWDDVLNEAEYISPEYASLLGYEVNELRHLSAGKGAISFLRVHPDDQARVLNEIQRFNEDQLDYQQIYRVVRKDGAIRTFRDVTCSITDERKSLQKSIGCTQDITEIVDTQDDLELALADAMQANRVKSEFLASMSHELRTPLNAILGFSDILSEQYFGPPGEGKYREYANDIHQSGLHLLELVNELLDVSAIEAGKITLSKEHTSIVNIVEDCNRTVAGKALSKSIKIVMVTDDGLPSLYADKRAVKQILLNLLSNAIKFSPEDGSVTISMEASDTAIIIVVTDNGPGIPPDKLSGVTSPFIKGVDNPHVAEQGWGLGLPISKSLTELHGGTMSIRSEVGKGTSVTINLPLKHADTPDNHGVAVPNHTEIASKQARPV